MFKETSKRQGISRKIREKIENGVLPEGVTLETILDALKTTKLPNTFEMFGFLSRKHTRKDIVIADGLVSCRLVTGAFANYLVDSLQNSTTSPMDVFRYHGVGTGNTAEANSQTSLVTEVETRVSGTQEEGSSSYIFKSVATVTFTGSHSIAEHGLFSASSNGTMMDRSVFGTPDVVTTSDEIEYTYQLTVSAET
jgi:hypothetical protein